MLSPPEKVLLVEDAPSDRDLIRAMLEQDTDQLPLTVLDAETLEGAIRLLESKERIDAVLLDLGLSDSQGIETLSALLDLKRAPPIIVLTGLDDRLLGIESVRRGAQDFLNKNELNSHLLIQTIEHAIERAEKTDELVAEIERRKVVEGELRFSEERIRDFGEAASDWFWEANNEFCITYLSDRFYSWSGFRIVDVIGRHFDEITSAIDDATLPMLQSSDATKHENFRARYRSIRISNGDERYISISGKTVFNAAGRFIGYRGTGSDVTELVNQRRQNQEDKIRLETIMETIPDGILTVDENGRIESANLAIQRIFGWTSEEILEQPAERILADDFWERVSLSRSNPCTAHEEAIAMDGNPQELHGYHKDGSRIPLEAVLSETVLGGEYGVVLAVRDISERIAAQQQLIQTSKMATLGEMATAVAHELNQPLSIISMAADRLVEALEDGVPASEFLEKRLDQITSQVTRATSIIDHMRIFGRKDAKKPEPFDPIASINGATSMMNEQLRLRSIDIEVNAPSRCHAVRGYSVQFEQALLNLLANARDAIEDHRETLPGKSGTRSDKIAISVIDEGEPEHIRVTIQDTGGGIPEDICNRIFDPFFTTKKAGKGTGLGLSITYGIINDMGGHIAVTSNGGEGACFVIDLPVEINV